MQNVVFSMLKQKLDSKLACGRIENVPALKIFGIALKPHYLCNLFYAYRFILCKFTIRNLRKECNIEF